MAGPTEFHPPTTTRGVYQQHLKGVTTSKSYLGRVWHVIALGAQVILFPIPIIRAAVNRYNQEGSILNRRIVKVVPSSELSECSSAVRAMGSVSSNPAVFEDRNKLLETELSKSSNSSLVDKKELLLLFLKKHKFPYEATIEVLSELRTRSPNSLKLLLTELVKPSNELWSFVNFWIGHLQQGTESEIERRVQIFFGCSVTRDEFSEICQMAKALYLIESSRTHEVLITSAPNLKLIHTSPGLTAANGNQVRYQKQFIATVKQAAKKIKTKSFNDILEYIAHERHEMAQPCRGDSEGIWARFLAQGNLFGIKRAKKDDGFHTDMIGPYEKYRDLFLKSDKQKWKFDAQALVYQMEVTPKGKERPIQLTRIKLNADRNVVDVIPRTVWFHTPQENIQAALEEAQRVFNELPALTEVERTDRGLEAIMKAVGELHWWLAQACPYQRGSAAIAKMMVCAVLKHYGIEAGGFGGIEPDCIALIQHPDEFIENYSKLMLVPPPHWIRVFKWFF